MFFFTPSKTPTIIFTQPAPLFLVLFLSDCLVSYGGFDDRSKGFILFWGIILPLGLAAFHIFRQPVEGQANNRIPFWPRWNLETIHPLTWFLFGVLLVYVRFYRWEEVPFWPLMDDGQCAYWSKKLAEHWDWRILYGNFRLEPLSLWALALFFKIFGISLSAMRFFPLLLSILLLAPGYWAARQFFSRPLSFILMVLTAFQFWTLVCSRQCPLRVLGPLWEFSALGLLGSLHRGKGSWARLGVLALILGTGFYIYASWPAFVLAILAALWWGKGSVPQGGRSTVILVGTVAFVIASPLIVQRLSPDGMVYIKNLFDVKMAFRYVSALFFDGYHSAPYGPVWGGLFNGVSGALVLLGSLECLKWRKEPLVLWLALASFLLFLPGALTSQVEIHRITLLVPLLTVLCGFGIQALAQNLKRGPKIQWALIGSLLLASSLLDIYHYFRPYQDWNRVVSNKNDWESIELSRAYHVLKQNAEKGRKFAALNYLDNFSKDRTFEVAVSPLAVPNSPNLSKKDLQEVVLLANINFKPFLEKRFPHAQWIWLCPDIPDELGGVMLGFIPYEGADQMTLDHWLEVDHVFQSLSDEMRYLGPLESADKILEQLLLCKDNLKGDAFLTAEWGARAAFLYTQDHSLDRSKVLGALKEGIQAIPAAHLFDQLGLMLVLQGDKKDASKAFQEAMSAPLNCTSAAQNLQFLAGSPPH